MISIEADDFARRFAMRANSLMWFLGAGASASAGIPTAADMIWEFKQQLYVSQRRISLKSISDLSNPAVRNQIQSFIDSTESLPAAASANEYAALFESAWPNENDRRTYIDGKLNGARPSYGHFALASLMHAGLTKLVWTTNFDPLIADACAKVYDGTGALTTVALDAPELAEQTIATQRWPLEIKLHGDFRSRRLKNTGDELRQQDARLRKVLVRSTQSAGLVVAGYSGRDDSILDALSEALETDTPFPSGLFWLHRGDGPPLPRVQRLLTRASEKGVDGGIVVVENFDETMRDLVRLTSNLNTAVLDAFSSTRKRWSPPTLASGSKGFPVIRLNGLAVDVAPSVCRRVVCNIGGYSEVAAAVEASGNDLLFARSKAGVLAFGRDVVVNQAFKNFSISEFDLHPIDPRRLRYDSAERGLLRKALSRAMSHESKMRVIRRRVADLLYPTNEDDKQWSELRDIVGPLSGSISNHPGLVWREGIGLRLEWADERLWAVFEPRTIFDGVTEANRAASTDFGRERTVRRYNPKLNALIAFWSTLLSKGGEEQHAMSVSDGVDAVFRLSTNTAFSRRLRA